MLYDGVCQAVASPTAADFPTGSLCPSQAIVFRAFRITPDHSCSAR
jgi:hypothetical protein